MVDARPVVNYGQESLGLIGIHRQPLSRLFPDSLSDINRQERLDEWGNDVATWASLIDPDSYENNPERTIKLPNREIILPANVELASRAISLFANLAITPEDTGSLENSLEGALFDSLGEERTWIITQSDLSVVLNRTVVTPTIHIARFIGYRRQQEEQMS